MADNDNNKRRRLAEFKDGCRYGKFGKTKAYELIAQDRIRAYKMGGKTMIDLDSVDEYHTSLPRVCNIRHRCRTETRVRRSSATCQPYSGGRAPRPAAARRASRAPRSRTAPCNR